jgi:hypothetical protein
MQDRCAAAAAAEKALKWEKKCAIAAEQTLKWKQQMQQQEQEKMVEKLYKNPHKLYSKKWWRWNQYGDDSDRDCKTCGERCGFASWAHCSDRCLIDDVGYEVFQDAMKERTEMDKLRFRPGWKSEFEKEDA